MKYARLFTIIMICESLIFSPLLYADQIKLSGDLVAPEVQHTPDSEPAVAGSTKKITATVTDDVGVKSVILFYRFKGEEKYNRVNMQRVGESDEYSVEIKDVISPGIEYYLQAADNAGNTLLHGYEFSPLIVSVKPTVSDDGGTKDNAATTSTATVAATDTSSQDKSESDSGYKKWLWIGLGVLAVGALAGGGGGGGGGGDDTASLNVSTPTPSESP